MGDDTAAGWRVKRARMSLLHASFEPSRLGEERPLARYADYERTLASLSQGVRVASFELPWESGRWSYYWGYLLGKDYQQLHADALAARVIPVRVRPTVAITAQPPQGSALTVGAVRAEGLIYPHAAVTIVTIDLNGDATIADTANELAALASERLTLVNGQEARLNEVSELVASHVRASCAFGEMGGGHQDRKFRIFSAITGATGGLRPPGAKDEVPQPVWAAIRAIGSLRPYSDYEGDQQEPNKLLLSWGSGKPAIFSDDAASYVLAHNYGSNRSSNSCYHRNQVLLVAHLLALTPLATWGAPHLSTGDAPVEVDRLVPAAATTLAALTGRSSYRSALTPRLIAVLDPKGVVASQLIESST